MFPTAPQTSHVSASNRLMSSLLDGGFRVAGRSCIWVFRSRLSGIPPNRAISGFLPSLSTVISRHFRGPWGSLTVFWYLARIRATLVLCLFARVLSNESLITVLTLFSHATFWVVTPSR